MDNRLAPPEHRWPKSPDRHSTSITPDSASGLRATDRADHSVLESTYRPGSVLAPS